jgi:hypothetical protein
MGVFAWFRRGGRGVKPSTGASTGTGAGEGDGEAAPRAGTAGGGEAVTIPKQTVAAEAADSETGEGARQ